ncbi:MULTISPECIES: hypothetical protein [Aquimarina]|uniref:Uncharacterized protein n=1 Tax=Aquimarina algiphila TaxID=2047982 RepID=A0A554VCH3_9FLAO|nr:MULTISPECIES: hypothetical protein [Aquimarina]TSE04391.1 hypothetical protein FOF46_26560 [Aquimarina algiphila]
MKGVTNNQIRIVLLICFISLYSSAQDICDRCFGFGRVACWKCDGKTITHRDKNGLGVFCSECACSYCDKDNVGTGRCGKCKGLRYVKKSSLRTSENDGSWGDAFEGALELTGIAFLQHQYSKSLETYKTNYSREKRKYREYEKNKKQLLREQAERERKRRIEKENNREQYDSNDIVRKSRGKITNDYREWLGSFKLSYPTYQNKVEPLFRVRFKNKKNLVSKTVNLVNPLGKTYLAYNTPIHVNFNIAYKAALVDKKMADSIATYGYPCFYIKLEQKSKYGKKASKIKYTILEINDINILKDKGLVSNNYINRIQALTKKKNTLTSSSVSYVLPPFMGLAGKLYNYELSIYIASKKDDSNNISLIQTSPLKTYLFEYISLDDLKKSLKKKNKWKVKEIRPEYYKKNQGIEWSDKN